MWLTSCHISCLRGTARDLFRTLRERNTYLLCPVLLNITETTHEPPFVVAWSTCGVNASASFGCDTCITNCRTCGIVSEPTNYFACAIWAGRCSTSADAEACPKYAGASGQADC